MANVLGIDHPLIAVEDIDAARRSYEALGFSLRPTSQHPWGTSTVLAVFDQQLLELVSIGDASLLDDFSAGDFRFGRHVAHHLEQRQGVALTALYSDDAEGDAAAVQERGGECAGTIHFGRDVQTADGRADRTSTTLKVFRRAGLERLTMFACQQHRRDLIQNPAWMRHPNGVSGIASATIMAGDDEMHPVRQWLETLHGHEAEPTPWGFRVPTGRGSWRLVSRDRAGDLFGAMPEGLAADGAPSVVSLDFRCEALGRINALLTAGGFAHHVAGTGLVLTQIDRLGGLLLTFQEG